MRPAHLADVRLDAVLPAERAVLGAVVARVGVRPADDSTDDPGQAQGMGKEPGVMDVGGRAEGTTASGRPSVETTT